MTRRPTLLLVDDDPAVRGSLAFSLELEGFGVESYASAEELAARRVFPADGALIVDQRLPGMDGLTLLARLRGRGVRLPAVLITSSPSLAVRARAAGAGVSIVEKPLMCDALTAALRRALAPAAEAA